MPAQGFDTRATVNETCATIFGLSQQSSFTSSIVMPFAEVPLAAAR